MIPIVQGVGRWRTYSVSTSLVHTKVTVVVDYAQESHSVLHVDVFFDVGSWVHKRFHSPSTAVLIKCCVIGHGEIICAVKQYATIYRWC